MTTALVLVMCTDWDDVYEIHYICFWFVHQSRQEEKLGPLKNECWKKIPHWLLHLHAWHRTRFSWWLVFLLSTVSLPDPSPLPPHPFKTPTLIALSWVPCFAHLGFQGPCGPQRLQATLHADPSPPPSPCNNACPRCDVCYDVTWNLCNPHLSPFLFLHRKELRELRVTQFISDIVF